MGWHRCERTANPWVEGIALTAGAHILWVQIYINSNWNIYHEDDINNNTHWYASIYIPTPLILAIALSLPLPPPYLPLFSICHQHLPLVNPWNLNNFPNITTITGPDDCPRAATYGLYDPCWHYLELQCRWTLDLWWKTWMVRCLLGGVGLWFWKGGIVRFLGKRGKVGVSTSLSLLSCMIYDQKGELHELT